MLSSSSSKEILTPNPVEHQLIANESQGSLCNDNQIDPRVLSPINDLNMISEPFSSTVPIFCSPEPKAFALGTTTPDCSFIPVKKAEFNGQFPLLNNNTLNNTNNTNNSNINHHYLAVGTASVGNSNMHQPMVRNTTPGGTNVAVSKALVANKLTFSSNQGGSACSGDMANIFNANESVGTPLCAKQLLVLNDRSSGAGASQSGMVVESSTAQQRQQKTPKTFKLGMQREENAAGACNTSEFKTNEIQQLPLASADPFSMALTEKKQVTKNGANNVQRYLGSAGKKQNTMQGNNSSAKKSMNSNEKTPFTKAYGYGSSNQIRKRPKNKTEQGCLQLNDFYPQQIQLGSLLPTCYEGEDLYADILTATSNQPTSACQGTTSASMLTVSKNMQQMPAGDKLNSLEAAPVLSKRKKLLNFGSSNDENVSQPFDRFIPCRLQENLQGKFEAVSVNSVEYLRTQENIALNAQQQQNQSTNYQNIFGSVQPSTQLLQLPQISQTAATSVHEEATSIQLELQRQQQNNKSDQSAEQLSNSQNFATYSEMLEESIFSLPCTGESSHETDFGLSEGYANLTTDFKDSNSAIPTSYQTQQKQAVEPVKSALKNSAVLNFKRQWSGLTTNSSLTDPLSFQRQSSHLVSSTSDALTPLMSSDKYRDCYNQAQASSGNFNNTQNIVRKIAAQPFRILDAPHLCDDFYLNLVDWSASNQLAVALDKSVYIYNANTAQVSELTNLGDMNQVTSVSWSSAGGRTGNNYLSVGTLDGQVQIWDINRQAMVRTMRGHLHRVGATAWQDSLVASGSKDKTIFVRDLRMSNNSYVQHLFGHRQEVCGLRWSPHDQNMLASGGNDNKLMLWQVGQNGNQPIARFGQHGAAVKAINWSPLHRGLLATGGGTADQCIRFWNTLTMQPLKCVNTGSQVCNLVFSKTNDELVTTHGYSLNQVIVWKYPSMEKIATLTGHTYRVLYLAMSPDGSSIVTGAGDETLRFWNVFPKSRSCQGVLDGNNIVGSGTSSLFPSSMDFR